MQSDIPPSSHSLGTIVSGYIDEFPEKNPRRSCAIQKISLQIFAIMICYFCHKFLENKQK